MTKLALNKIHWPVTALGPGRRIGIWLQGCSVKCPGCMSLDTWDTPEETWTTVAEVLGAIEGPLAHADGVTISGGEPFDQPEALLALAKALREAGRSRGVPLDLLCYSGRALPLLRRRHGEILAQLDVVISDPFAQRVPTRRIWRGSGNQRLTPLTELGHERYDAYLDADEGSPHVQLHVDDDAIWMIGIPGSPALERVERQLAERGIAIGEASWRS